MRITPLDVRQQQFTVRTFRGFDVQEVDAFLQDVAEDYEAVLKENALLKEQLAILEERARGFADLERTLQDTLVTGQRMTEELKANARREAQLIVDEAQLRSEKLLDGARTEEARLRAEMQSLKRLHRQLAESVKVAAERYVRLADGDLGETATE
jgi:cell division initiation protein